MDRSQAKDQTRVRHLSKSRDPNKGQLAQKSSGVCMAASILSMRYCGNGSELNKRSTETLIKTLTIIKVMRF
jgi:hypothetical protein